MATSTTNQAAKGSSSSPTLAAASQVFSPNLYSKFCANVSDPQTLFVQLGQIGAGTYGVVTKVKRKQTSVRGYCVRDQKLDSEAFHALKRVHTCNVPNEDGFAIAVVREISILREIQHENIIQLEEVFFRPKQREAYLLFEYAEYDLWSIMQHHRQKSKVQGRARGSSASAAIPEQMQKSCMKQLLNGIHYLHENWILHRDLKPANILVTSPNSKGTGGRIKIGDLGLARLFCTPPRPLSDVDPVVVTYWYRAPELLLGSKHYTKAVDMWAAGCIMGELIGLRPLFHTPEDQKRDTYHFKQLLQIFNYTNLPTSDPLNTENFWASVEQMPHWDRFQQDYRTQRPPDFEPGKAQFRQLVGQNSQKLDLMRSLLKLDPKTRVSAADALRLPYFREAPLPTANVFECIGDAFDYPDRAFTDEKKPANKSSSSSTSKPPAKRAKMSSGNGTR